MIRILLLEHSGGTELAAEALNRVLPARRPLRAPVPERRFTPPAKRKSDLAPSLKGSLPSLLSRFAGGEAARDARASSAWAVVVELKETFYIPADPQLNSDRETNRSGACLSFGKFLWSGG